MTQFFFEDGRSESSPRLPHTHSHSAPHARWNHDTILVGFMFFSAQFCLLNKLQNKNNSLLCERVCIDVCSTVKYQQNCKAVYIYYCQKHYILILFITHLVSIEFYSVLQPEHMLQRGNSVISERIFRCGFSQ